MDVFSSLVFPDFFYIFRHAKSRNHAAIGRGNIFRLRKDKGWNTVEYVETIRLNPMNDLFIYMWTVDCGNTLMFLKGLNHLYFL